jgi:hypothetical protein
MTDAAPAEDPPSVGKQHQETFMARYIDIHFGFVGATEQQLLDAHRTRQAVEGAEGVRFEGAWLDQESGTAFCLCTAPSREAVLRAHELAGDSAAEVYEISIEVAS